MLTFVKKKKQKKHQELGWPYSLEEQLKSGQGINEKSRTLLSQDNPITGGSHLIRTNNTQQKSLN